MSTQAQPRHVTRLGKVNKYVIALGIIKLGTVLSRLSIGTSWFQIGVESYKPQFLENPKIMKASAGPSQISYSTLKTHLHSYEAHVPEKIHGLEEIRLREVPETLDQRKKDSNAFLEKTEVTALVEWKLFVFPSCSQTKNVQALTSEIY